METATPSPSVSPSPSPQTSASLSISDGATYDFGHVTAGATSTDKTFTVANSGTGAASSLTGAFGGAQFIFKGGAYPGTGATCGSTLSTTGTCTLITQFTPSGSGPTSDTLTLTHSGRAVVTRAVTGTGDAVALLTVSDGPTYDYTNVSVGSTSNHTFSVTNSGGSAVSGMSGSINAGTHYLFPGGYPGTGGDCGVALTTTGACNIVVRFAPASSGVKNDSINIAYNNGAANTNSTRAVTGTGTAVAGGLSGALDTTFSTDGVLEMDFTGNPGEIVKGIAFHENNKIALFGQTLTASTEFVGMRLLTDGGLDTSFNTTGKKSFLDGSSDAAWDVAVQTDGKTLGIGSTEIAGLYYSTIVRFRTDGTLDTTFGSDGSKSVISGDSRPPTSIGRSIIVQTDGQIVSAIQHSGEATFNINIARQNASDGTLDSSFATDGVTSHDFASVDHAYQVILLTDGRLVAAGNMGPAAAGAIRMKADGSLDTTFQTSGMLSELINTTMTSIAVDTQGRYVAAFEKLSGADDFVIGRYLSDGSLDTSFHTDSKVSTDFSFAADSIKKVLIGTGGTIYGTGRVTSTDFGVAKYLSDGSLDTSFSTDGMGVNDINGVDTVYSAALYDNRLCLVGTSNNQDDYAIVCYSP